ncbi:hypothetical protein A2U01_0044470, partial [Trifolium medium]|nr:hypothetical protein [Trifolium medium]
MKDVIFIMPNELSAEFAAVKNKIRDALDKLEKMFQEDLKAKLHGHIEKLVKAIEDADVKMITNSPHLYQEDLFVLNCIDRAI